LSTEEKTFTKLGNQVKQTFIVYFENQKSIGFFPSIFFVPSMCADKIY
jgi:hypothetical protein